VLTGRIFAGHLRSIIGSMTVEAPIAWARVRDQPGILPARRPANVLACESRR
jgi:hypothetical protein